MQKILLILTISFLTFSVSAQDDMSLINLTPYVSEDIENLPVSARSQLQNKLKQIVTQNGVSGSVYNPRFIITAKVNVLTKDILPGPPPSHAYTLDVTLMIGDGVDGKKFASTAIEVRCVGTNETKAYISGIRSIKADNSQIQRFIENGKQKIIDYYNANCDEIIAKAKNEAALNNYGHAIYLLTSVPQASGECYSNSLTIAKSLFKKYIERDCKEKLREAQAVWAATQTDEGAGYAARIISTIDPDANCYNDVVRFRKEVSSRVKSLDAREWEYKVMVTKENFANDRALINAYKDIRVAYAKSRPRIVYHVHGW